MSNTKKPAMSSYKVDFKFKANDNTKEFGIGDFHRYWGHGGISNFEERLLRETHADLFVAPEGKGYWETPIKQLDAEARLDLIKDNPAYAKVNESFNKWAERRNGVKEAYAKYSPDTEFNVFNLALANTERKFLRLLEKARPIKFTVGQLVTIANNCSRHLYDPFYYKRGLENTPRVGVVTRWTDDTGRRAGIGSRELRIMWLASGDTTQIPIRLLRSWERPEGIEKGQTA